MLKNALRMLCFSLAISATHEIQASAQTNQQLLQERLISPAVYELLNRHNATTPVKRLEVIQEACRASQLHPSDCGFPDKRRTY